MFPRIALSAEASDAEAAVQPGTRYRHVMSPNHLVGNIVSQGVKSFAQGRGPKLLVTQALDLGARVAEAAVWKFTPTLEDFPQDGIRNMWLRHRLTLHRQSVLRPQGIRWCCQVSAEGILDYEADLEPRSKI